MKQYILKDGTEVQAIPIGRSSVKIGEKSPEGMLIVCDRGPNNFKNRGAMVICQCKCGNYTLISLNSLRNNHIKSCGCYNKEYHKQSCKKIGQQSYFKDYSKDNSNPYYKFIKRLDKKDKKHPKKDERRMKRKIRVINQVVARVRKEKKNLKRKLNILLNGED